MALLMTSPRHFTIFLSIGIKRFILYYLFSSDFNILFYFVYFSHLDRLIKLHLEQNEISGFSDSNVFCNLPNLLDLHLGDNQLTSLQFNLSCLHQLRFLDLQRNAFTKVQERDLKILDTFAKHNQSVTIDLSNNKFECGCKLNPFIKWMKKTKIIVRNKNYLECINRKLFLFFFINISKIIYKS